MCTGSRRASIPVLLAACLLGHAAPGALGQLAQIGDLDGSWTLTTELSPATALLTIKDGRVVGLDGDGATVADTSPAAVDGDCVAWKFVASTPVATSTIMLSVVRQPDGSLRGMLTVDSGAVNSPQSVAVVMVRAATGPTAVAAAQPAPVAADGTTSRPAALASGAMATDTQSSATAPLTAPARVRVESAASAWRSMLPAMPPVAVSAALGVAAVALLWVVHSVRVVRRQRGLAAARLGHLAHCLFQRGDFAAAELLWREAAEACALGRGRDERRRAAALNNRAVALQALGDIGEALRVNEEVLRLRRRRSGGRDIDVARTLDALATLRLQAGAPDTAEEAAREAYELRSELLGEQHPDVARSRANLEALLARRAGELRLDGAGPEDDDLR